VIILYRTENDAKGDEIQAALEELVVAHRVEIVPNGAPAPVSVEALPAVVDGERVVSGQEALDAYLHELAAWMAEWRKYQSDVCYVDDDGNVC
jgi:hypothetical protein